MLLYYITDRRQFRGDEREQQQQLLNKIAEAARNGIDYVQLREKDVSGRELEGLAREAIHRIRESGAKTRFLINSRADVALAMGADGVHLRSNDISPEDVRKIWNAANNPTTPIIAVSCHNEAEMSAAEKSGADFVVFGPIFGKQGKQGGVGLECLRSIRDHKIPVLALGGITLSNASLCMEAGASGIAGIRLFQENAVETVVERLRG